MSMVNDIKNFIHAWCGKNKVAKPSYDFFASREMRANGTINNQPSLYHAEMHIAGVKFVAHGKGKAKKVAQTEAARAMAKYLVSVGRMRKDDVKKVPGCDDLFPDPNAKPVPSVSSQEIDDPVQRAKSQYKGWKKAETVMGNEVIEESNVNRKRSLSPEVPVSKEKTDKDSQVVFFGRKKGKLDESLNSTSDSVKDTKPTKPPEVQPEVINLEETLNKIEKQKDTASAGTWRKPDKSADKPSTSKGWWEPIRKAKDDVTVPSVFKMQGAMIIQEPKQVFEPMLYKDFADTRKTEQRETKKQEETSGSKEEPPEVEIIEVKGDSPTPVGTCASRKAEEMMGILRSSHARNLEIFSQQIERHYTNNAQDEQTFNWKMGVRRDLQSVLQRGFAGCFLFAVGSTVNLCGSYNSDMDLCLVVPDPYHGTNTNREYAMDTLRYARPLLWRSGLCRRVQLIAAKVPILKIELSPPNHELELDINCNNVAGIYNSHLLHYYARADPRFSALTLMVKHWAINAEINDAMSGTLNSYSLILLVLHYLQVGVNPPVLPNLQKLFPEKFSGQGDVTDLLLFENVPDHPGLKSENTQSAGELLCGFFGYYAHFDWARWAISIRRGELFPANVMKRNCTDARGDSYEIWIEEPFDKNNTARCVNTPDNMKKITDAFAAAYQKLCWRPGVTALRVEI